MICNDTADVTIIHPKITVNVSSGSSFSRLCVILMHVYAVQCIHVSLLRQILSVFNSNLALFTSMSNTT